MTDSSCKHVSVSIVHIVRLVLMVSGFLVGGCGGESTEIEGATGNTKHACVDQMADKNASNPLALPHSVYPNSMVIVANDLEGYFTDCGCAGDAVGGLQRFPNLESAVNDRTIILTGWIFCPPPHKLEKTGSLEMASKQIPVLARSALAALAGMGRCIVLVSDQEKQFLRTLGFDIDLELSANGISSSLVDNDGISMKGERLEAWGTSVGLSGSENSRGRRVSIACLWSNGRSGNFEVSHRLGVLFRLAQSRPTEYGGQLADELALSRRPLVATWTRTINVDVKEDHDIRRALGQGVIALSHSIELPTSSASFDKSAVVTKWQKCSNCHQSQFDVWSTSAHSSAFARLVVVGKNADYRCLSCHTSQVNWSAGQPRVQLVQAAVTCLSCHKVGLNAKSSCTDCHTILTDPKSKFAGRLGSICASGRPLKAEPVNCSRSELIPLVDDPSRNADATKDSK